MHACIQERVFGALELEYPHGTFFFLHEAPNCGTLENRKQEKTDKKKGSDGSGVSDDSLAFTTGMQRPTARIALEYGETGTQETGHGRRCDDV